MPSTNFVIRGKLSDKPKMITMNFRYKKEILRYPTKHKIQPSLWDEKNQRVRNRVEAINRPIINKSLKNLEKKINKIYEKFVAEGIEVNNSILREKLNEKRTEKVKKKKRKTVFVQDYLEAFIENAPMRIVRKNGKSSYMKERTIKQYKTTLQKLKNFDTQRKRKCCFVELNEEFHLAFTHYLRVNDELAEETIGTCIKNIKTLAKEALKESIKVNRQVFDSEFYKPSGSSIYHALDENEIDQIFKYDFSDNPRLDNARDLFIIGLWTGQRVSDFTRFKKSHFNGDFIELDAQLKTDIPVIIPIHPMVRSIINKYDGGLPRMISTQKFNQYIKEVCEVVGLDEQTFGTKRVKTDKGNRIITDYFPKYELVSSHICRRSFATNLFGQIPNMVIMQVTGHKKESTFLKYIKKSQQDYAKLLKEHWDKKYQSNLEVAA